MTHYFATKYDSARDEVVALLADEAEGYGMRDDTAGDVDYIGGCFALVTIPADVLLSPSDSLPIESTSDQVACVSHEFGVTPADVIGSHIVTHDSQGFVSVETFDTEEEARAEFDCRAARFAEWGDDAL